MALQEQHVQLSSSYLQWKASSLVSRGYITSRVMLLSSLIHVSTLSVLACNNASVRYLEQQYPTTDNKMCIINLQLQSVDSSREGVSSLALYKRLSTFASERHLDATLLQLFLVGSSRDRRNPKAPRCAVCHAPPLCKYAPLHQVRPSARPPTIPSYAVPYMQNVVTKKEQRQSHAKALKQEMNGAHLLVHAMYLYDATGASSRRSR